MTFPNIKNNPRKKIENCELQIEFSKCYMCEKEFYLGPDGHCFHIQLNHRVPNCWLYEQSRECVLCENKFYLNLQKNECIPISKSIEHCGQYSPSQVCQQCEFGYFLSKDGLRCHEITKEMSTQNCMFFRRWVLVLVLVLGGLCLKGDWVLVVIV